MTAPVLAVLGGSFDPPHLAHLEIVRMILDRKVAADVLVVPCVRHVLGKVLTDYEHRLRMCELMIADLGPTVAVSDIERREGLSGYTIDTLTALGRENPDVLPRLVVGADILDETDRWRDFERIRTLAPPIVVGREGHPVDGVDLPAPHGVSSTRIREILSSGGTCGDLVPAAVLDYIEQHRLYGPR